jgi:methylmalonyl-CoA carboxyltransferase 1.3S subunit
LKLRITIEGRAYEVEVELLEEDEAPPPEIVLPPPVIAPPAPQPQSYEVNADPNACCSPLTGLVIKVHVEPGQVVAAGELILVLEAMKMETNVTAPRDATVKAVHVKPGDPVKSRQILVEFDEAN